MFSTGKLQALVFGPLSMDLSIE